MKAILLSCLLFSQIVFADSNLTEQVRTSILEFISSNDELNSTSETEVKANKVKIEDENISRQKELLALEKKRIENAERKALISRITMLITEKNEIDEALIKDNLWASVYLNHETYQLLDMQLKSVNDQLKLYKSKSILSKEEKIEFEKKLEEYQVIEGKLSQLKEYKTDPFIVLVAAPDIGEEPTITNPLDIITAMSFQKQIKTVREEYIKRYESLQDALSKLHKKSEILQELVVKTRGEQSTKFADELRSTEHKIADFERTLEIFKTSASAFDQKVSQINLNIDDNIDAEIEKSIITGSIILFILLLFFFIKYLVKKYMSDNELFYGTNKVINFLFIVLVFNILLFSYLENIEHLVTVLSFASAGIAIALKDWFMSLMGWVVILVSGSIHVGDRMKFVKDGVEYVGDIVDISVLRMTLHEDVTLTTVMHNKRSGRIIFIPNNYIFTDMIANYSHSGLKTVWDGIEFFITFDSNVAKAQLIAKDVTR